MNYSHLNQLPHRTEIPSEERSTKKTASKVQNASEPASSSSLQAHLVCASCGLAEQILQAEEPHRVTTLQTCEITTNSAIRFRVATLLLLLRFGCYRQKGQKGLQQLHRERVCKFDNLSENLKLREVRITLRHP